MARNIVPPWDTTERMSLDAVYGGIYVGTATELGVIAPGDPTGHPEAYDNLVARVPLHAANAMSMRIRQWTFTGSLTAYLNGDSMSPVYTASWSIVLKAARYFRLGNIDIADEDDLCRFGGWRGDGTLLSTPTGDPQVSSNMEMWFGAGWFPPGFSDENGQVNASGKREVTIHTPALNNGDTGTAFSFSFGKFVRDVDGNNIDSCPMVATLPVTRLGSFDGSGLTSFRLEIGGSNNVDSSASANVIGSATFSPSLYWSHSGRWDPSTGARL